MKKLYLVGGGLVSGEAMAAVFIVDVCGVKNEE